jgi:hypothetical protein
MSHGSDSGQSNSKRSNDDSFFGINGTWTKLLRFATPMGVVAIGVGIFNAGGTLSHIDDLAIQNCRSLITTQAELHKEHKNDRFRGYFPPPPKNCAK